MPIIVPKVHRYIMITEIYLISLCQSMYEEILGKWVVLKFHQNKLGGLVKPQIAGNQLPGFLIQ